MKNDFLRSLCFLAAFFSAVAAWSSSSSSSATTSRRNWLAQGAAAGASCLLASNPPANAIPKLGPEYYDMKPVTMPEKGRSFFPALTPPFRTRATYRYELGRNAWALEQLLTFANVTATIRTNVIRLQSGGLWVHSPLYPTGEFCALLDDIGGDVEHVVLPCNAFEHKGALVPFCKKYPKASVWIAPGQYSPLGSCGLTLQEPCNMGVKVDGILGSSTTDTNLPPWVDEFDYTTLYVNLPQNAGPVSETAFLHKPTSTLVAVDAVAYIPDRPVPDIFRTYFDKDIIDTDPDFWRKSVLQGVFLPLRTDKKGNYPGFEAIKERLVRAPILRGFNDARAPDEARDFISVIASWKFDRILTNHFASPILVEPRDVRNAFSYLFVDEPLSDALPPIACQDWDLLQGLNDVIADYKLGAPATFDYRKGCLQ
jgi:hypothetical protein